MMAGEEMIEAKSKDLLGTNEMNCHILEKKGQENSSVVGSKELQAKYTYLHRLGKGAQGEVWLAKRQDTGEKVAIKQLNVYSVTTWKQYELFKREANILASLNICGIARFYEYIEELDIDTPRVCIVQKYIEGHTLAEMLKTKHRFSMEAIYDIIAQVLKILKQLHACNPPVIHRDIKPSNLILTPTENGEYTVTLIDFGAVANPQVQTGGSTVAGTFGYMPPEQLMGQAVPTSDIYALGAVAVEMLSGVSPADIEMSGFKLVIDPYLEHIPEHVVQALSQMLEPMIKNRTQDYDDLIALFVNLAKNKKTSLLKRLYKFSYKDFKDIQYLCQDGSYEVWQNLDIYHIPEQIRFWAEKPSHQKIVNLCDLMQDYKDGELDKHERPKPNKDELIIDTSDTGVAFNLFMSMVPDGESPFVYFITLGIIIAIAFAIIIALLVFTYATNPKNFGSFILFQLIVFSPMTVIFLIMTIAALMENKSQSQLMIEHFDKYKSIKKAYYQTQDRCAKKDYIQILKQGTRVVGRITDIIYVGVHKNHIEIIDDSLVKAKNIENKAENNNHPENIDDSLVKAKNVENKAENNDHPENIDDSLVKAKNIENKAENNDHPQTCSYSQSLNFIVHHPPRFLLVYQFQMEGQTLSGQLITSTPPEDHYNLGDVLTLVAKMEDENTYSVVPYPYPIQDNTVPDDIIFKGKITESDKNKSEQPSK